MSPKDLILVPEPKLSRFVFGGYALDEAATVTHYQSVFAGKTAQEVIFFLESAGLHVFYSEDPNRISILLERLVTFFYYRVSIEFTFKDGMFDRANIWSSGVK